MLRRLAPKAPIEVLQILADTLDPQGIEVREVAMRYAQDTPLNRIVDAARGDSAVVRRLEGVIRAQLKSPSPGCIDAGNGMSVCADNRATANEAANIRRLILLMN